MTERVLVGGLSVAKVLYDFIDRRCCRARAWPRRPSGPASTASCTTWRPRTARCSKKRDALQAKIDAWHQRAQGQALRPCRLQGLPGRDRLPGAGGAGLRRRHRQRRCRDRPHRRAAAGGAGHQRPLCAERRQRALGQPLRRAVRHRRAARGRRGDARRRLQSRARRQGVRLGQALPRRGGAARQGLACRGAGLCRQDGRLVVSFESVADTWLDSAAAPDRPRRARPSWSGWPIRRSSSAIAATRRSRAPSCCATTACTSRSRSTTGTTSARTTSPASPMWCWRRRSPPSSTWRIRSPPSIPTTRSAAYRNWLGLMNGTLSDDLRQGRQPT